MAQKTRGVRRKGAVIGTSCRYNREGPGGLPPHPACPAHVPPALTRPATAIATSGEVSRLALHPRPRAGLPARLPPSGSEFCDHFKTIELLRFRTGAAPGREILIAPARKPLPGFLLAYCTLQPPAGRRFLLGLARVGTRARTNTTPDGTGASAAGARVRGAYVAKREGW